MRNLRKFTAVVIAIALVLTSMTAAFAATTPVNGDKAATLKSLGIYSGTDASDPAIGLDGALTTQDSLVYLTDLFGYADAVNALTDEEVTEALAKFADADDISTYAKKVVAYAATNGILSGSTKDGEFFVEPKATVTAARFATFIVKKMGYAVADYREAVALLAEVKGSKVSATETGDLTRDAAVGMMYAVLPAELAAGTTVIAGIVGTDAALIAIAEKADLITATVTTLAVDSVTSNNLREVFVKFSKAVDETTAEDKTNYSSDTAVTGAELQADKVTVKLTIANGTLQQKVLDLVIKNVKDAAGVVIAETKKSITLFDTAIPEAKEYKFVGPQTIEVTMSEPINGAVVPQAIVDNGIYGASVAVKADNESILVIKLGTVIPEGPHKLILKGAKDFAAYAMLDKEFAITYTKDSAVSVVTIDSAAEKKVTLKFSKPVKFTFDNVSTFAKDYFYQTYTTYKPKSVTTDGTTAILSGGDHYYDTVVLDFTDAPLPAGSTKIVVRAKPSADAIVDAYGIVLPEDVILTATITVDVTAPTITKVEAVEEDKVEITYSEDVLEANAKDKANYTFKKADGTVYDVAKISTITYADKKATVNFIENLAGGANSVEVKNIKDNSVNANAMVIVPQSFIVSDKTVVTAITDIVNVGDNVIYVTYPEVMSVTGANSVLNTANYMFDTGVTTNPSASTMQVTNAAITVFGTADKVKIEFPTGYVVGTLYIRNVADAAGNVATAMYLTKAIVADAAPVVESVKTIALDKVEIVFSKELSSISADNISFGGVQVAQVALVNKDAKATVTATLKDTGKLASTAATVSSIQILTGQAIDIKSLTGKPMNATNQALNSTNSKDGMAPTVTQIFYATGSGIIAVMFSENIDANTIAGLGTNGFKVGDKTVTGASIALNHGVTSTSGSSIVLLYGDFGTSISAFNLDVTYTPGGIADADHNAVAAFTRTDDLKQVIALSDLN